MSFDISNIDSRSNAAIPSKNNEVLMPNFEEVEIHFRNLMIALGIDLNDPNFTDTPKRVAKSYKEIFAGLSPSSEEELKKILSVTFPAIYSEMVVTKNIGTWSMCPHHFLPVKMKINVGYIPENNVIGLSKIPRIVNLLAARPSLQEQLTTDIVTTLEKVLAPKGAIVQISGEHLCMQMRGVQSTGTTVTTTAFVGCFEHESSRAEFFRSIKQS